MLACPFVVGLAFFLRSSRFRFNSRLRADASCLCNTKSFMLLTLSKSKFSHLLIWNLASEKQPLHWLISKGCFVRISEHYGFVCVLEFWMCCVLKIFFFFKKRIKRFFLWDTFLALCKRKHFRAFFHVAKRSWRHN